MWPPEAHEFDTPAIQHQICSFRSQFKFTKREVNRLPASMDMTCTKDKALNNFVTQSSRKLFCILNVPDSFIKIDPETQNKSEHYKIALDIICFLATSYDYAEKDVGLMQPMTQSS